MAYQTQERGNISRSPDFVSFYANASRIAMSFADIRMYFYETIPEQPESLATGPIPTTGTQTWLERAAVTIAPEYLKILAEALADAVKQYEETFGQIRKKPPDAAKAVAVPAVALEKAT